MTFGGQWAWNPDLDEFTSGSELIAKLIEVASRGGNLLMNVGPRGDGRIQSEFADALRHVGRWLDHSGPGIHGTTFGPIQGVDGVRTTADAEAVYLHVLADHDGPLRIPAGLLPTGPARALAADAAVDVRIEGDDAVVDLGRIPRDEVATTIEVLRRRRA